MKYILVNRKILADAWQKEVAGYLISGELTDPSGLEFDSSFNDFCKALGLPEEPATDCSGCWDEKEYLHTCGKSNANDHPLLQGSWE